MVKSLIKFVLPFVMGLTVELFKPAIPYLPWLWFGILIYYTWEALTNKYVLGWIQQFKHGLSLRERMFSYIFIAIIGAALFSFYWWALTSVLAPKIAAYEAEQSKNELRAQTEIAPRSTVSELPTFHEKVDIVYFQLGNRGLSIAYNFDILKNAKVTPFVFYNYFPITLYVEDDILYADIKVYGGIGEPSIEIIHNNFSVRKAGWDRNYNREAFEVVDDKFNPIFQFTYKTKTHILFKGLLYYPKGLILADETAAIIPTVTLQKNPNLLKAFTLKRIFKYPSSKYLGQLDDLFKPK